MRALVEALVDRLGDRVVTGAAVSGVAAGRVRLVDGIVADADAVVLACRAADAASLLGDAAPPDLGGIRSVSTGVVFLVYPSGTADALPDATGFVVPRGEGPMTAATFLSRKWPEPAFGDRAVVRCFVGGDGFEDVVDEPDDALVDACARHLSALLDLPAPASTRVHRWRSTMPQYEPGHLERVRRIRSALPPGIVSVGAALDGVGVSDLVRAAGDVVETVLAGARAARKEPA